MYLRIEMKILLSVLLLSWASVSIAREGIILSRHVESNELETNDTSGKSTIKTTQENCQRMLRGLVKDIRALSKYLSATEIAKASGHKKQMLNFKSAACSDRKKRAEMFNIAGDVIRMHSKKVGVILPLSNYQAAFAQSLKMGIEKGSSLPKQEFEKRYIFVDSNGTARATDHAIAKLYFLHDVTAILGGFSRLDAERINYWSKKLLVPSFITHHDKKVLGKNKRGFLVFPNKKTIYKGIANAMKAQRMTRLAILLPNSPSNFEAAKTFTAEMTKEGITVVHQAMYNPEEYSSMEQAAKKIFEIDHASRRGEYNRAYRRMKRKARRAGIPFNPRVVAIPPRVNMDAVYIGDSFKSVRYMAKIFDFLGVKKIKMIGNQQWRARSLIQPWDPFLDGSVFIDYVGSYQSLPQGIQLAGGQSSPYFSSPSQVQHLDFKLVGYLAGKVSAKAVQFPQGRSKMHRMIKKISVNEPSFFGQRNVFNSDQSTNWPSFKFLIGGRSLQLSH